MKKEQINHSTVRWVRKNFKNLSEEEILEKASLITQNYLEVNKEQVMERERMMNEDYERSIDREFIFEGLFWDEEE